MLVLGFFWLLFAVIGFVIPVLAIVLLVAGIVILLGAALWFVTVAAQEDGTQAALCVFLPVYAIYYLCTHWDTESRPFFAYLMGVLMVLTACVLLGR
jgi:hypothetical protein